MTACSSADTTAVWEPAGLSPKAVIVPRRNVKSTVEPATNTKTRLDRIDQQPREPGTKSKLPLSAPQRRTLESERQTVNSEIRALERRAQFDGDTRAVDERRLRALKARQRRTLRRLRGE